jgi:hypothetical protein
MGWLAQATSLTLADMSETFKERVGRPGFWWSWAAAFAVLGVGVGLAPVVFYDTDCGSALHPSSGGACEGKLDVRFGLSLALLVISLVALAVGLVRSRLSL